MTKIEKYTLTGLFNLLLGLPSALYINSFIESYLVIDGLYCYEYRFPKLSWFLDFFYYGHHYEWTFLNYFITLFFGIILSYFYVKVLNRIINKLKSNK